MCLQCVTEAEVLVKNILPGYSLMIAKVGHKEWPKGSYGLVRCDDPDYVWKGRPIIDSFEGMSDKEINALSDDSLEVRQNNKFFKLVEKLEPQFKNSPELGYDLYRACKKAGYSEIKHGRRLLSWLVNHMALKMKK